MVKPLVFKGEKKPKKRKRSAGAAGDDDAPASKELMRAGESSATAAADQDDESWVSAEAMSDISGPVIIVLPTEPPTTLSCDALGKVFAMPVENLIEGDPSTAEPHDVRQVWVANRIAGTESISFKGHHGKYLGCDKYAHLSADSAAVSPEQSFLIIPVPNNPSTFSFQTAREKFLTIDDPDKPTPEIRGDAEEITFNTTFRVRMQARFKPKHKVAKEERSREKISRKELEEQVGRRLEDDEVKRLKKARREGNFHEAILDVKVKGKHDKFA